MHAFASFTLLLRPDVAFLLQTPHFVSEFTFWSGWILLLLPHRPVYMIASRFELYIYWHHIKGTRYLIRLFAWFLTPWVPPSPLLAAASVPAGSASCSDSPRSASTTRSSASHDASHPSRTQSNVWEPPPPPIEPFLLDRCLKYDIPPCDEWSRELVCVCVRVRADRGHFFIVHNTKQYCRSLITW